jgi:hypothetical protein
MIAVWLALPRVIVMSEYYMNFVTCWLLMQICIAKLGLDDR